MENGLHIKNHHYFRDSGKMPEKMSSTPKTNIS